MLYEFRLKVLPFL